ncbi:MAG: hypothetical protein LBN21_05495 [Treponema sp.]|jgi:class 3 adenylate cyclase|nr:hypothetical protein [Treponema sp.]
MSSFISGKKSLLILSIGLFTAAVTAVLLNFFLSGPRLGPVYDFLLNCRAAPPAARDILLIETEEIIESGDLSAALITLSEMGASALIVQVPALGFSSARSGSVEEIRRRFNDEFNLLGRNIRNLFEAIRVGSVSPGETGRYVENLVELAERGKDRLTAALIQQDEAGTVQAARASAAFGRVFTAGDLRPREEADSSMFSRPQPDRDGKLRRLYPVQGEALNVVYAALLSRWESSEIEYTDQGPVLINRTVPAGSTTESAGDLIIPLDRAGGILFEGLHPDQNFRRIPLARFREYEEADRELLRALKDAEARGVYSGLAPEAMPVFLHEYAQSLREEFLDDPTDEKRAAWIDIRTEYFNSLDAFLGGPSETNLVLGFEELIATEKLPAEGSARLVLMRDELIRTFDDLRENHRVLADLRAALNRALSASFCIMGPVSVAQVSAQFANVLFSGVFIAPGQTRYILFWSLLAAFIVIIVIHRLRPSAGFPVGLVLSLLCGAGFSWSFIISGYWIDPVIAAAAALAGSSVIFFISALIIRGGSRRFRLAYGPHIGKPCLEELIRAGRPLPEDCISAQAAIIAVREDDLLAREDRLDPPGAAKAVSEFRKQVREKLLTAGGVVLCYEGDMVLGCFGSPLERISLDIRNHKSSGVDDAQSLAANPAVKAGGFIAELLQEKEPAASWRFGVDCGECVFSWTAGAGYTAVGRPVVRSRILSGLAPRYQARVLIGESVREHINLPVRKLETLGGKGDIARESFYELLVKN